MRRAFHQETKRRHIYPSTHLWAIAIMLLLAAPAWAQDSQSGSLADVARQVRAQKQSQPDSNQARTEADQAWENEGNDAPSGFKTYYAGDYRLWVPAPYTVEGHDDTGIVLSGPAVGSKRPTVLVGSPMAFQSGDNDPAFLDVATRISRIYSPSASCGKIRVADHSAYKCNLTGVNLLGHQVNGHAVFVRGARSVYPVFCVFPSRNRARDILNNPHASSSAREYAEKELGQEEQDAKTIWQKCDTVFGSIRLKPEMEERPAAVVSASTAAPSAQPAVAQARSSQVEASTANATPAPLSSSASNGVPAGYKIQPFQYCNGSQQCWNASVLVPVSAQLISSDCKRFVFETKAQGTAFLLLAGPAISDCDGQATCATSLVRWKQLADPESSRAPGTYSTISSQVTQLGGRSATITALSFRNGLTEWMGKRIEVESNGVAVVVGCLAPRDHFDDGDAICSTMIGSLQLP